MMPIQFYGLKLDERGEYVRCLYRNRVRIRDDKLIFEDLNVSDYYFEALKLFLVSKFQNSSSNGELLCLNKKITDLEDLILNAELDQNCSDAKLYEIKTTSLEICKTIFEMYFDYVRQR